MMMNALEVLGALPVAVYTTDIDGQITFFNEAAVELWGHRPALGDKWCGSWRIYQLDGRHLPHEECPMAVCLKEKRAVRGERAVAERPDGSRVIFAPYPTPLTDASGEVVGAVNVLLDITRQYESEIDLAKLAAIVESSDDAIVSKNLHGRITSWNAGAARIFGYEASEIIGEPISRLIPKHLQSEELEIMAKLRAGERTDHFETVRVGKDGRALDVSITISPLRDSTGKIMGASKIARDISGRKRSEKVQRLMMDELNHRIKNTLSVVQAVGRQSLRFSKNNADFVKSFGERIQALAKTHDILTNAQWEGADLKRLILEQVGVGLEETERLSCSGPTTMLDAQAAVHLAMVVHELATNARKFGSLSASRGKLKIFWEIETQPRRELRLTWEETGGPLVNAPERVGFGSTLIQQTIKSHDGTVSMQFQAAGLQCEITFPLPPQIGAVQAFRDSLERARTAEPQSTEATILKGKRVLIMEDEPLVCMDLEETLARAGCQVLGPAGTVAAAMALLENGDIDAALLDANLNGESSLEIAGRLVKQNTPFAFVTGYGANGLPEGFGDQLILAKPYNQNQLLVVVETLLYKKRINPHVIQMRQRSI